MPVITEDFPPVRVLIVDDNPTVHEAFTEILGLEAPNEELAADEAALFGEPAPAPQIARPVFEVDHAMSGKEGVEKVRQSIEADLPYQLAFVDIRMPGMDGVETIGHIWKVDSRIQTVICTAYADYEWQDLARLFGQTDRLLVLKKPFHNIEVLQMAGTLAQKWFLGKQAVLKLEQMEALVAQRTQRLLEYHRREHQRVHEQDQSKLNYMLRLAQDFCGPLTLIVNPVEELLAGTKPDLARLELIRRNVQSLLQLVENSFLLRRLEPEDRKIQGREIELVSFVKGLVQGFVAGASERKVQLQFECGVETQGLWTDADKLEKVLFNLLACMLAATVNKGRLVVQLRCEGVSRKIIIESTLRQDVRMRLQEEAGRVNLADLTDSDITLLLSQQMLILLNGSLHVEESARMPGADARAVRLTLMLPELSPETLEHTQTSLISAEQVSDEKELPLILLIEENADLRTFLTQGLGAGYRIAEAASSASLLAAARESVPDLIIADVDPSQRNVLEMCAKVKADQITSHIPIILVGADMSDAARLSALEVGADDCVAKPFRLPLLKARVENLLETRRKLHQHFQDLLTVQPRELALNQMDAEFLRRVVKIVEKNLSDYEFDVETLARLLAVSRRQLFRKFKAVAGCTPNVFIRNIRLKHAAQMLLESRITVSEIIYAVGFSDPKYFRTVFRERFGVLPGEYGRKSLAAPKG